MKFNTIGDRVKYARKKASLSVQELHTKTGLSTTAIYDLERGDSKSTTKLARIGHATGFNPLWLEDETPPERLNTTADLPVLYGNSTEIPYFVGFKGSAGSGFLPLDEAQVVLIRVARTYLRRLGISPKDAFMLQASGESMEPHIMDNAIVIGDYADTQPIRDGHIYVVRFEDEILIKMVQKITGGVKLLSYNPIFDPVEILHSEQHSPFQVIGRVKDIWTNAPRG